MRDTDLLRLRVQAALTCFSLALAAGCGDDSGAHKPLKISKAEARPAQPGVGEKADPDPDPAEEGPDPVPADPVPAGAPGTGDPAAGKLPGEPPDDGAEGEFDYYGPPRDPYADHDEEEGCPKGDWCGSPSDAAIFEVKGIDPVMGCPARIVANPEAKVKDKQTKRWKGFSFDARMQGRVVTTTTEATRKQNKVDDLCCYHWFEYCSGRPLLDDDVQVLAALRRGDAWSSAPQAVGRPVPELGAELRQRLAAAWLEDARMEHASIAAFARATLELMSLAAPAELLSDVQRAAIDEVRHARHCFALGTRYGGVALEPGPLPMVGPRETSFERLACDTFVEGCVGETIAALTATRQLRHCEDEVVRATLTMIADDEARHAALAWRTVEWALAEGGRPVAQALGRLAAALRPDPAARSEEPTDDSLRAHGRLGPRDQALARLDAWGEIVLPTLARLLAGATDHVAPTSA